MGQWHGQWHYDYDYDYDYDYNFGVSLYYGLLTFPPSIAGVRLPRSLLWTYSFPSL